MEAIGERFQKLLDNKGVTPYEVSMHTGISQATLSRILNKNTKPNIENRKILAEYFNVTPEFILHGSAEDKTVIEPYELEYSENKNSNTFFKLENGQYLMTMPLAEFNIQAGLLDHYQDIEYMKGLDKHSIIVDQPVKGRYMAFRVKGDSMDDGTNNAIMPNSIVSTRELQPQHWTSPIRIKDFEYWVIYTKEARMPLLKQIVAHNVIEGKITCHSLNDSPEYNDFELSLDEVQALFYVVDVHKQLSKKLSY